ncbi:hypothetical protein F511_24581 [Dorcoceras hygrometricum]|uniref:Uncharacterized protein n=1 Tax=Dorcoceras hygrometricum TaxID=472368 RepID=A0A2Z7DL02_9LAMI|nr:hypothetical protein F511_24581 [Dorcoceras hygrometricum]
MASSLVANALQVNFDSVLGIPDNNGMFKMFRALESTGLRGFLGCPSVLYEKELEQFFDTTLVKIMKFSVSFTASFLNCVDRSDLIVDRDYDGATVIQLNRIFIRRGPDSENDNRQPLKCQFPREIGRSQVPRRQQDLGIADPVVQVDTDLSTDPVFADQVVQMEKDQRPDPTESDNFSQRISDIALQSPGPSSSTDSHMLFTTADIPLNDKIVVDQLVFPAPALPASVLAESLAQLQTYVSQLSIKQMRTTNSIGNLKNELLSKIDNIEKFAAEARTQQDHVFRDLIKSVKHEVQLQKTALSLKIIEFKKGVWAHSAIVSTYLADIRKEMHEQKAALSQKMDDKLKADVFIEDERQYRAAHLLAGLVVSRYETSFRSELFGTLVW